MSAYAHSSSGFGTGKRLRTILSGLALAALAGPALAQAPALPDAIKSSGTLTFCSAMSQPPLEFVDENQNPIGLEIELGDALAKRIGVKTKWINIPFSGLIPALQAGQCDAILSQLFIKPARLEVIDQVPYSWAQEILVFKKGSPVVDDPVDMSGKKVASVTGTTATVLLEEANDKLKAAGKAPVNIVEFPTGTAAFQQLLLGQVDGYGASYEIGQYYDKTNPGEIVAGSKPFFKILSGIGIRKDEKLLSAALDSELAAMMKDGSYAALFQKWGLESDMLDAPMPTQPVSN